MTTYLITGANGFIGRHLMDELYKNNNIIYGVSRRIPENFIAEHPEVMYEQCNLIDHASVFEILKRIRPDCIFHLAAESSVASSWKSPINIMNNNILSQINIFEVIRELELSTRIIVACSSEEYGLVQKSDIPVNEKCCFNPVSTYAVSKISQDMLAFQYFKSYNMDIVRVRSFNVEGPGRPPNYALSSFAKQIAEIEKGSGNNTIMVGNLNVKRDYTDVRDAVKAYHQVSIKGKSGSVYNLCSGKAHCLRDLLDYMVSLSNSNIKIEVEKKRFRPSDLPLMLGDNTKLRTEIGWTPEIDIHETLVDILNYWRLYKS